MYTWLLMLLALQSGQDAQIGGSGPDWWTIVPSAAAAVVAVLSFLGLRAHFLRPKLAVEFAPCFPDLHFTVGRSSSGEASIHYYLRCRVRNSGRSMARDVVVALVGVERKGDEGYRPYPITTPFYMTWAYTEESVHQIPAKGLWHISIGHIIDPRMRLAFTGEHDPSRDISRDQTLLSLNLFVLPGSLEHLLEPGDYRLTFQISAANASARQFALTLRHSGQWGVTKEEVRERSLDVELDLRRYVVARILHKAFGQTQGQPDYVTTEGPMIDLLFERSQMAAEARKKAREAAAAREN